MDNTETMTPRQYNQVPRLRLYGPRRRTTRARYQTPATESVLYLNGEEVVRWHDFLG